MKKQIKTSPLKSVKNLFLSLRRKIAYPAICFPLQFLASVVALPTALFLRLGDEFLAYDHLLLFKQSFGFTFIAMGVFFWTGCYQKSQESLVFDDFLSSVKCAVFSIIFFIPYLLLTYGWEIFPSSAFFIVALLFIGLLHLSQLMAEAVVNWNETRVFGRNKPSRLKVLLVGTGPQAEFFLREMGASGRQQWYQVVGAVGLKPQESGGASLYGVKILGSLAHLSQIVKDLSARSQRPDLLVLTDNSLKGQKFREFLTQIEALGLKLSSLPSLTEFSCLPEYARLKPILIENFLEKTPVSYDEKGLLAVFKGKKVLITGAGGGIAKHLLEMIAKFAPAHVVLMDHHAPALFDLNLMIQEKFPYLSHRLVVGDVRDREKIFSLFHEEKPDLVFHGAALKHFYALEPQLLESVSTDVLGSAHVADACVAHKVGTMVFLSHHSALLSKTLEGVTKRFAESYAQSLDLLGAEKKHNTRFISIRFGNVLGSCGSVVSLFRHQIANGGPVTLTHPEMIRSFLSVPQVVSQILQTCVFSMLNDMGRGKIFTLSPGEPLSILDLAENMVRLAGLRPHADIQIAFTGLRPGEPLQDDSFAESVSRVSTELPDIFLESPTAKTHTALVNALEQLRQAVLAQQTDVCVDVLKKVIHDKPVKIKKAAVNFSRETLDDQLLQDAL